MPYPEQPSSTRLFGSTKESITDLCRERRSISKIASLRFAFSGRLVKFFHQVSRWLPLGDAASFHSIYDTMELLCLLHKRLQKEPQLSLSFHSFFSRRIRSASFKLGSMDLVVSTSSLKMFLKTSLLRPTYSQAAPTFLLPTLPWHDLIGIQMWIRYSSSSLDEWSESSDAWRKEVLI